MMVTTKQTLQAVYQLAIWSFTSGPVA